MKNKKRLIDADALKSVYERYLNAPHVRLDNAVGHGMRIAIETCMELLENESTVDAVEVERCKDCKYWDKWGHKVGHCIFLDYDLSGDLFCAFAERRTP